MKRFIAALLLFSIATAEAGNLNICPRMPIATATANNWVSAITAAGATTLAQPGFSNLSGNIATSQMNSGTSASSSTFWRGDGSWTAPTVVMAPPTVQTFTTGSGTYNKNYTFVITSGSATAAATYTNNGVTYTVWATVASATQVVMNGSGPPTASGTLTKASGTGDSTLTFSQVLAPLYIKAILSGGGGGGGGGGAGSDGTNGSNTTFGSNLTAGGGLKGKTNGGGTGAGGTNTVSATAGQTVLRNSAGGNGQISGRALAVGSATTSGLGGMNSLAGGSDQSFNPTANSGAGGGGGSTNGAASGATSYGGDGGGAGGYLEIFLSGSALANTFSYAVGAGGNGGAGAGTGQNNAGPGAAGVVIVEEHYQ